MKAIVYLFLTGFICTFSMAMHAQSPALSMNRGKAIYSKHCLSCHQVDGGGVPHMNPPLIKTSYVLGDKLRLIKVVLQGFPNPVDIDGGSYSNTMAAHDFLKDQEIADVLTYVRNSFENKAAPVKVLEVKRVRVLFPVRAIKK